MMVLKSEKAAQKLSDYLNMLPTNPGTLHIQEFKLKVGGAEAHGLIDSPKFKVANTFVDPFTEFDWHDHRENEYFMVVDGGGTFCLDNNDRIIMGKGDCLHVRPMVRHRFKAAPQGCEFLVVTIPGSPDFPTEVSKKNGA